MQVTLEGGEKLYQSTTMDPETRKLQPAGWKSVGQRQRVHRSVLYTLEPIRTLYMHVLQVQA